MVKLDAKLILSLKEVLAERWEKKDCLKYYHISSDGFVYASNGYVLAKYPHDNNLESSVNVRIQSIPRRIFDFVEFDFENMLCFFVKKGDDGNNRVGVSLIYICLDSYPDVSEVINNFDNSISEISSMKFVGSFLSKIGAMSSVCADKSKRFDSVFLQAFSYGGISGSRYDIGDDLKVYITAMKD